MPPPPSDFAYTAITEPRFTDAAIGESRPVGQNTRPGPQNPRADDQNRGPDPGPVDQAPGPNQNRSRFVDRFGFRTGTRAALRAP